MRRAVSRRFIGALSTLALIVLGASSATASGTPLGHLAVDSPIAFPVVAGVDAAPAGILRSAGPASLTPLPSSDDHRELVGTIGRELPITSRPGAGRIVGTMPATSRYYGEGIRAWVQEVSSDGRWGLVTAPYTVGQRQGWIPLRGLDTSWTRITVEADLSRHELIVRRGDDVVVRAPMSTGAPGSPTPTGRFFVTDRVGFPGGGVLGTFAFGISGIQPNLPAGWTGGDQMAIHGTNAPWTIGRAASAGCLRVSERVLDRLKRLLRLGTPVEIHP